MTDKEENISAFKQKLHDVIFEAETPAGKFFDIALFVVIVLSVLAVIFESVEAIHVSHRRILFILEWVFTIIFTIEYILRLICVARPWKYATSFFGVVDLLAIIPTYLSLLVGNIQSLLVIRVLRLLRLFRVFKLVRFSSEAETLVQAIRASRPKITVFLGAVFSIVIIMGAIMHLIEGEKNGFYDIPTGMYWAVVTMTTVGYGDFVPHTVAGKIISSILMIMGYGLIAIPTGIVSSELTHASRLTISTRTCPHCSKEGHDADAIFCRFCSKELEQQT